LAEKFAGIALGTRVPIGEHFEAFLSEQDVREKTLDDHRRALDALRKHHQIVSEVDRKAASAFVRERLLPSLKPATINRRLNTYRQYWDWLKDRGYIPEERANPWLRQSVKAKKGDELKRRAFTEEEAAAFLNALGKNANKYPDDLPAAMLLAVTGMRAEEAASLDGRNVKFDGDTAWVTIEEGKTDAASRRIPITEELVVRELRRRIRANGYVFPDLGGEAKQNSRGNAFKKRAARVLDKINDSPEIVANHSWRNRATDMLERGGNDRYICDYYVGHSQKSIGLNTYVSEMNREKLMAAARCMYLPEGFETD
jgi:integrase